jgi:hypothetical protein
MRIKNIAKVVCSIFGFVCMFTLASAQNVEVKGTIVDENGEIIPFASVMFTDQNDSTKLFGTIAGEEGKFSLSLPQSLYVFRASVFGIQSESKPISLANTPNTIELGELVIKSEIKLEEVEIKAIKDRYDLNLDKKKYDVSQNILAKGGSLADVMQSVPSVQVDPEGNISLRGDQNVTILIDNRLSSLVNSKQLLRTIPASSIERIEVITNPSAKFSAQGSAGIINVVLKKSAKNKLNASMEIFSGFRPNAGTNLQFSKNKENNSWFINTGLGYSEPKGKNSTSLKNLNSTPDLSLQASERYTKQKYLLLNAGIKKQLTARNSISASFTYRGAAFNNDNNTLYQDYTSNILSESYERLEETEGNSQQLQTNLDYYLQLSPEGHELKLGLSAELTKDNEGASIENHDILISDNPDVRDLTIYEESQSNYIASLDYSYPVGNHSKLELGYKSTFNEIDNDFSVERITNSQKFRINEFTDQTGFIQNVHAFYGQYEFLFSDLSVALGVRTEATAIKTIAKRNSAISNREFLDWFPSLSLGYKFSELSNLKLSLSKRINRPPFWALIPFSSFTDEKNIFIGNTELAPSYTYAGNLGFSTQLSDKLTLNPSVFYSKNLNEMEFFVEKTQIYIENEPKELFTSYMANIGEFSTLGTEFSVSYLPFAWWNIYGELSVNKFRQRGTYKGASFDGEGILMYGNFNTTFTLINSLKFQIQTFYRGPIETGQYSRKAMYVINLGLSKSVFNEKGSISLNVSDLFNSGKRMVTTYGEDFTRDLELQYRTRQVNLSVTYRFNKKLTQSTKGNQYDKIKIIN